MDFKINEQRKSYLNARGKIVLNACPGSGKTTSIAKKLIELQKDSQLISNKHCGIACLSFTNTAKNEINEKYSQLSGKHLNYPHIVSTIDSFINKYITLPYAYLLNDCFKRPKIIDDNSFIDELWKSKFTYKDKTGKVFCFKYPPSSIRIEHDHTYTSNGSKPNNDIVDPIIFKNYCLALKKWQFKTGLISTNDSAYLAIVLLDTYPQIGKLLTKRFPYIVIDEAQDNSELQYKIFDKLNDAGLKNLEYIGDPYQSLYEWRDAKPKLFLERYLDDNWQGLDLTENWRSSQRIVDCFSLLRLDSEFKIETNCEEIIAQPIIIYKYSDTNSPQIIKHYDKLCKDNELINNQILVRGNTLKNEMLGIEISQEPWKNKTIPYKLIEAKNLYLGNNIKETIKIMRKLAVILKFPNYGYKAKREKEEEIKIDNIFNSLLLKTLHDLPSFDLTIKEWTKQTQTYLKSQFGIEENINFELKNRNSKLFNKCILSEPVNIHFKKSYSDKNTPISTIHQIKGKSLCSVLIFFNRIMHKENITFDDIRNNYSNFPSEKQRIIYVAMSRPKHLLAMAFPETISNSQLQLKFGTEIRIINESEL